MKVKAISDERVKAIKSLARLIWRNYSPYELQQKLKFEWNKTSKKTKFIPLYTLKKNEVLSCAIFGSGSFLTGRKELEYAREIKNDLGWSPIEYKLVVTNKTASNARTIFREFKDFGLNYVELDFKSWYRKKYNKRSKSPIKETRFFYPPGSPSADGLPQEKEIEKNFNIRKEFDRSLNKAIMKYGSFPSSISLRGYNFPVFKTLIPSMYKVIVDDTHPADMSYLDKKTKLQLYAGWQSHATQKMKDDNHSLYRSSLIAVDLLDSFTDSQKVDTGILYSLSPGISPPKKWSSLAIQINMKQTEDYFFNVLKATGLFPYLWGISESLEEVEYRTLGRATKIKQRLLIVGNQIKSGKDAWGQSLDDLKYIKSIL
ncbi:hypothetical protein KAW65_06720 [candidate division WOR-3 bacterium]|nr:hypothetical protein [candidate division WOR-3 bacterium]